MYRSLHSRKSGRTRRFSWLPVQGTVLHDARETVTTACAIRVALTTSPADFSGDGFVNGDYFDSFAAAFAAKDASAHLDKNEFVTGHDFDAYVIALEARRGSRRL